MGFSALTCFTWNRKGLSVAKSQRLFQLLKRQVCSLLESVKRPGAVFLKRIAANETPEKLAVVGTIQEIEEQIRLIPPLLWIWHQRGWRT